MGFVGGGGPKPNTLSPEEVSTILDAPAEQEEDIDVIDYIPGDQVRVIEGPFRGFVAEVNRVDVDKRRLHLNISIFGRVTPFDLEFFEVEKLE
jgi:transcriptional antiterminator NusG